MSDRQEPSALALDLPSLDSIHGIPPGPCRIVCLFQASPQRIEALQVQFPRATILQAAPSTDGPWQRAAQRDLDELESVDVTCDGVPILDCFRAALRDDLALLRALQWGLGDIRRVIGVAGTPLAAVLERLRETGALQSVSLLPPDSRARIGILTKLRRAGVRGAMAAFASRVDPSGVRRARFLPRLNLGSSTTVLVSAYVNPTRAALEAHAASGGGEAVLVASGPGATIRLSLPDDVRKISLPTASTLETPRVTALRSALVPKAAGAFARWGSPTDPWAAGAILRVTSLGRALPHVHLPEVVGAIGAIRCVLRQTGARRVIVGDEFSFVDRAAIHVARALGVETVCRQHGVLDSHYLHDRILSDRYLAWDTATIAWLMRRGALTDRRAEALPRSLPALAPHAARPRHVAVFLQPFAMIGVSPRDWLSEAMPSIVRAATSAGLDTVLKPHPLQSAMEVSADLPPAVRGACRLVTNRTARDLLTEAALAVTLDSSVAVDCKEAGVPCLSTAWYAGTYAAALGELGYVVPTGSPADLEATLVALLSARAAP